MRSALMFIAVTAAIVASTSVSENGVAAAAPAATSEPTEGATRVPRSTLETPEPIRTPHVTVKGHPADKTARP